MNQDSPASSEQESGMIRNGTLVRSKPNENTAKAEKPAERPDPTRYGDWEKGGRRIDF